MTDVVVVRQEVKAPGCYGHASIFKHGSPICGACHAFKECESVVAVKLKSMSKRVDIKDFIKRHDNESAKAGIPLVHESNHVLDARRPIKRKQPVSMVKKVLSEKEQSILDSLPKKVAVIGRQLIDAHLDKTALKSMCDGINPFPFKGKRFLHIACNLLIQGGFTRKQLKEEYLAIGWSEGTSASHVSMAIAIFSAFSITIEKDKVLKLNSKGNNL